MANTTITLRKGQNPLSFLGAAAVSFSSLAWVTAANVVKIQAVNANGSGYTVYDPSKPTFGPQSFSPLSDGTIAGYVVVTKVAVPVDASLFMPLATTSPGAPSTYVPVASDYRFTSYAKPGNGGTIYNPFWEVNFVTASDTLALSEINEVNSKGGIFASSSGVALFVNGVKVGDYPVPAGSGAAEYTTPAITLPGASGSVRLVKVRSGYVQGGVDYTQAMQGGILTKLTTTGPLNILPFTRKLNCFFGIGDSIMSGFKALPSAGNAYLMLCRDNPSYSAWDFIAHSWGSARAQDCFSDANRPAMVQATIAATRGYAGRKVVFLADGINDELAGYDATAVATAIGKYYDDVYAQDSSIEVHLSTPLRALTSVIPASVQSAFSTSYRNLTSTRPGLIIHDGQNAILDSDLEAGDVHPINVGNVHLAAWLGSEILNAGAPVLQSSPPVDLAPNQTGIAITSVAVKNFAVTIGVKKTNSTADVKASVSGVDFGTLNQLVFPNQAAGIYNSVTARLDGTVLFDIWPKAVVINSDGSDGSGTATLSISNVTVSGQTVTITASGPSAIEYSVDGTNYQSSNVFSGISNGNYSKVRVRLVGTNTTYTWPSTVVVGASSNTLTISNVTVNGQAVTITATGPGTLEYSVDGTNYQSSNSFANIAYGAYNMVRVRTVGTTTPYTWPNTVNVPSGGGSTLTISNVAVSGSTITITGTSPGAPEYSVDGVNYQNSNVFTSVSNGSYNAVRIRQRGTTSPVYTYPQTVVVGAATLTISNVTVSGSTVTITGSSPGTPEYSVDGTNYQDSNVFTGIADGTYNMVRVRQKGTSNVYTWPNTVTVNAHAVGAGVGVTPLQPNSFYDFTTGSDGYVQATRKPGGANGVNGWVTADKMIGYTGTPGLQGFVELRGRTNQLSATLFGGSDVRITSQSGLKFGLYVDDTESQALTNGSGVGNLTQFPAGTVGTGHKIFFYDDHVEMYQYYVLNGENTQHSVMLYSVPVAPTFPIQLSFAIDRDSAKLLYMFLDGGNLLTTPA